MTPYVRMVTKSIGHSPIKDQFTVVFFSMTGKLDSLTRPIWGCVCDKKHADKRRRN